MRGAIGPFATPDLIIIVPGLPKVGSRASMCAWLGDETARALLPFSSQTRSEDRAPHLARDGRRRRTNGVRRPRGASLGAGPDRVQGGKRADPP